MKSWLDFCEKRGLEGSGDAFGFFGGHFEQCWIEVGSSWPIFIYIYLYYLTSSSIFDYCRFLFYSSMKPALELVSSIGKFEEVTKHAAYKTPKYAEHKAQSMLSIGKK